MSTPSRAMLAGAMTALVAAGCTPRPAAPPAPSPAARAAAETLARLLNSDNGLMVRTCSISDDAPEVEAALRARQRGPALPAHQAEALRRGGLQVVRVRADEVEGLLDALGAAPLDLAAWYGQVLEWREVAARPIEGELVLVGADGLRRFGAGKLRLMIRSWTVATENGPSLYLEIVPRFAREVPQLSRLLGERGEPGEPLEGLAIELFLEAGEACVLTCQAPEAGGQSTAGEYLLSSPPQRSVLVLVPSIPARLFEPYGAAAASP